jgi:hypothetical protein
MKAGRWIVAIISVAAALSFAFVGIRCVLALRAGHLRASSIIIAVIAAWFAARAVQASTSAETDEGSILRGFEGGLIGAFLGILIVAVGFAMFAQTVRAYFAHPLGLYFSDVTMSRLLIGLVWLGFCAGFVLRIPKLRLRR